MRLVIDGVPPIAVAIKVKGSPAVILINLGAKSWKAGGLAVLICPESLLNKENSHYIENLFPKDVPVK